MTRGMKRLSNPYEWLSGMTPIFVSLARIPILAQMARPSATSESAEISAPRGAPVDPDVNRIMAVPGNLMAAEVCSQGRKRSLPAFPWISRTGKKARRIRPISASKRSGSTGMTTPPWFQTASVATTNSSTFPDRRTTP